MAMFIHSLKDDTDKNNDASKQVILTVRCFITIKQMQGFDISWLIDVNYLWPF